MIDDIQSEGAAPLGCTHGPMRLFVYVTYELLIYPLLSWSAGTQDGGVRCTVCGVRCSVWSRFVRALWNPSITPAGHHNRVEDLE